MKFTFVPKPGSRRSLYSKAALACRQASSIEELTLNWVDPKHSLVLRCGAKADIECLSFDMLREGASSGAAHIPVREILSTSGDFFPLDENLFREAPLDLPLGWMFARDQRLGIEQLDFFGRRYAPARLLTPLLLSYALAEGGSGNLRQHQSEPGAIELLLQLMLPGQNFTWSEQLLISRDDLRNRSLVEAALINR